MKTRTIARALAALACTFTAACVTVEAEPPVTGRTPAPDLADVAVTAGTAADEPMLILQASDGADDCVVDGCPDGLVCDWVQGCMDQAQFCCVDEQCGEGRYCDFDAGGLCRPRHE